jgi:hypothetical protein
MLACAKSPAPLRLWREQTGLWRPIFQIDQAGRRPRRGAPTRICRRPSWEPRHSSRLSPPTPVVSCCHDGLPTCAAAPGAGPSPGQSSGGRPSPGAAAHLLPLLAHIPQPPLTPLGYTLYPKGYRPQGRRAGHPLAPGRLPHAARARPRPPTRPAPHPPTRRLPAASHGAVAPAGMALATVLDSAKASGPSPPLGEAEALARNNHRTGRREVYASQDSLQGQTHKCQPQQDAGAGHRPESRPTSRPDEIRRRDSPRVNDRAWPQQSTSHGRSHRGSNLMPYKEVGGCDDREARHDWCACDRLQGGKRSKKTGFEG